MANSKNKKRTRTGVGNNSLDFRALEKRLLLASISYDSSSRIVFIEGSTGNDVSYVTDVNSATIKVSLTGVAAQTFSKASIDRVNFRGLSGNDRFYNRTNLVSHAFGHDGDDLLSGGSAADQFVGGTGNDRLFGNEGNDGLRGNEGDDEMRGGDATDVFFGGPGNDVILGQAGNDRLSGSDGDDTLRGGDGNDKLFGSDGADDLDGDDGDDLLNGGDGPDLLLGGPGFDLLLGEAGDDELLGGNGTDRLLGDTGDDVLFGGNDLDFLFGGPGNDELNGESGNDRLNGDDGNDQISGSSGNDIIRGGNGNDIVSGGRGNDRIYGGRGADELNGNEEADVIRGEDGNDLLRGGSGNDRLEGGSFDDRLYGNSGLDQLDGGGGEDGLFGGIGGGDKLVGGSGSDRFLTWAGDDVTGAANSEGILLFKNESSNWTEAEIEVIDAGLRKVHMKTQNALIIRDSLDLDPVVYSKWANLNGSQGINNLRSETVTVNGQSTTTYDREIQFADWNESNESINNFVTSVVIHELGHSWDSELEITTVRSNKSGLWNRFLTESSWRDTNPNSSSFTRSGDGEWWYRNGTEFGSSRGTLNPREDFSVVWEVVLDAEREDDRERISDKVAIADELFAAF